MSSLFGFIDMFGSHEERKVAQYDKDGVFVDTCLVTDSAQPYETAIQHAGYNEGKLIIVEMYDTKKESQIGHDKWVKKMTSDDLPEEIIDVSSAGVATLIDTVGESDEWRTFKRDSK